MLSRMSEPSPVEIRTPRLLLTMLPQESASRLLDYHVTNQAHLEPWDPPRPPGFWSEEFWRWRLATNRADYVDDRSMRLQVLDVADLDGPIAGVVSFTEIVRGPLQQCYLGYSAAAAREGQGVMREALEASLRHVFDVLALHRVMANYMPHNARSGRLLERLGFQVEGHARSYLYVDGSWRDHVMTALINDELTSPGARTR